MDGVRGTQSGHPQWKFYTVGLGLAALVPARRAQDLALVPRLLPQDHPEVTLMISDGCVPRKSSLISQTRIAKIRRTPPISIDRAYQVCDCGRKSCSVSSQERTSRPHSTSEKHFHAESAENIRRVGRAKPGFSPRSLRPFSACSALKLLIRNVARIKTEEKII